ncbi:MAG TPA: amidohydrolase family protein [Tepidisphaeraceae bacterium]|nr:amidohydrolase family protein [Tepidisphaeraceae bacterium]
MIIDCHVHISALTPGHGLMSQKLLNSIAFRFMQRRLGVPGRDEATERALEAKLAATIDGTEKLDAAVVLAFDAVHNEEGAMDLGNTHLYVSNDYVIELAKRHSKMLFGASVHPYRKDAVAELERCARAGAVLVKWLPLTQNFNPADPRCFPFYEALAHFKIPLLSHTGFEQSLPTIRPDVADPMLLKPAIERGVTIIAAHCGTKSMPWNQCYLSNFVRLAREYEHFYGDTSALNLPTRSYAYRTVTKDPVLRSKLVHGSDWPIIPVPPARSVGWREGLRLWKEGNWMRRDVLIKEKLELDDAYWQRAGKILRLKPT